MEYNEFDRWTLPHSGCKTWAYTAFNKYETELKRLDMSFQACKNYVFKNLSVRDNAKDDDKAYKYLDTGGDNSITIKLWRTTFGKMYLNWNRLNKLMALTSYFETYIASILNLVIESNPSVLLGFTKKIDGMSLRKTGETIPEDFLKTSIENCTKGEWSKRIIAIKKLLLIDDNSLLQLMENSVSELDSIRKIRNKVGHAFGRDIEDSQKWYETEIPKIESLSEERYLKWQKLIKNLAREIDKYVMENHVGCYQELYFYHINIKKFLSITDKKIRAVELKAKLYEEKKLTYNKHFCNDIINYYDSLT